MKNVLGMIALMTVLSVVGCGKVENNNESTAVQKTEKKQEKAKNAFGDPESYNRKPGERLGGL